MEGLGRLQESNRTNNRSQSPKQALLPLGEQVKGSPRLYKLASIPATLLYFPSFTNLHNPRSAAETSFTPPIFHTSSGDIETTTSISTSPEPQRPATPSTLSVTSSNENENGPWALEILINDVQVDNFHYATVWTLDYRIKDITSHHPSSLCAVRVGGPWLAPFKADKDEFMLLPRQWAWLPGPPHTVPWPRKNTEVNGRMWTPCTSGKRLPLAVHDDNWIADILDTIASFPVSKEIGGDQWIFDQILPDLVRKGRVDAERVQGSRGQYLATDLMRDRLQALEWEPLQSHFCFIPRGVKYE